ncbi:MAG: outer membrane lipoprotein [Thiobacillus sp.]
MLNIFRIRVYHLVLLVAGSVVMSGCASGTSGKDYRRSQPRMVEEVEMGRVESMRDVLIEAPKAPTGRGSSVIVGGGVGSSIGGGRGTGIGISVGTVLGGWGGASAEQAVTRKAGYEITLRLDSGRLIAVTQTADESFRIGDRVRVLTGNGVTRVSH